MNVLSVIWLGKSASGLGVKEYRIRCECGRLFDHRATIAPEDTHKPIRCPGCGAREPLARMPRQGTAPLFDLD